MKSTNFKVFAANGTPINTYGEKTRTLDLKLRRAFPWSFTIANVRHAIPGADFLAHYNLLVDLKAKRLIDGVTKLCTLGRITATSMHSIFTVDRSSPFKGLLQKFVDITRPSYNKEAKHNVQHYITTRGPPVGLPFPVG